MLNGFKTYLGIAVAALALLANTLGVNVPGQEELPTWLVNGVGLLGTVFAWYGRRDKERRAPEGN